MSQESKLEFVTICSQAAVDKSRGGRTAAHVLLFRLGRGGPA
jgi:hypothetical protein